MRESAIAQCDDTQWEEVPHIKQWHLVSDRYGIREARKQHGEMVSFLRWTKCLAGLLMTLSVAGSTTVTTTQQSEPLQRYVCTKEGRFRNRTDPNKYVTCTLDVAGGGFMKEAGSCPSKAFYNQRLDACVITLRTTTARPTTTPSAEESVETWTPKPSFKCTAAGRFPNPFTCHGYYMCYEDTDGTPYGPYEYSCPPYKHFSPTAKRCSYASTAGCTLARVVNE